MIFTQKLIGNNIFLKPFSRSLVNKKIIGRYSGLSYFLCLPIPIIDTVARMKKRVTQINSVLRLTATGIAPDFNRIPF